MSAAQSAGESAGENLHARADELRAVVADDAPLAALLRAARDRYVRTGSWHTGSVALDTRELREGAIALGCKVRRNRLSLQSLGAALGRSRFRCSVDEAVQWAFGEIPATRAEIRETKGAAWERWRTDLAVRACAAEAEVSAWLARDESTLQGEWHRDAGLVDAAALAVRAALETRGRMEPELVPVLAHRLTGDAHALDVGRPARRYLERILLERHSDLGLEAPLSAESRADLLAASGLAADGISSLVWAVGLTGDDPMLLAARNAWYPLALPLITIAALKGVAAARGVAFAVENRSVFGALVPSLSELPVSERPTLLCTSGNPSLAAHTLLARLVESGATIYYGGDTDARGLRIARSLEARFSDRLVRWHMDERDGAAHFQEAKLAEMAADLRAVTP